MSSNADGVKMVRYAIGQVRRLAPQVVNAAKLLASRPQSTPAQVRTMINLIFFPSY